MNKEKALEGIENLIQEGNNVLKTSTIVFGRNICRYVNV